MAIIYTLFNSPNAEDNSAETLCVVVRQTSLERSFFSNDVINPFFSKSFNFSISFKASFIRAGFDSGIVKSSIEIDKPDNVEYLNPIRFKLFKIDDVIAFPYFK